MGKGWGWWHFYWVTGWALQKQQPLYIMSQNLDIHSSRTTKAIDAKSERASRFLPYIKNNRMHSVNFKIKSKRSAPKTSNETHVRRYEQNQSITVLSIRFASSEQHTKNDKDEEMYIKQKQKGTEPEEQNQESQKDKLLPYLRYKRYETPEEQLRNMGYDPDVRIAAEVYSDKVQERKIKYVNKMESLKRDLQNCSMDKRHNRMEKSRIQVKILGEQIRRKRQRQLMVQQERRGHRQLHSLLNPIAEVHTA